MWIWPPYHHTGPRPQQRQKRDPRSTTFLHPPHSSPAKYSSNLPTSPLCPQCKPCFAYRGESNWFPVSLHLVWVFSTSLLWKLSKIEAWESTLSGSSFLKGLVQMSVIDGSTGYDHCKCLPSFFASNHPRWHHPTAQNAWHILCLTF